MSRLGPSPIWVHIAYTLTRNHWVLKEENSLFWHTVVLNWINKFSGLPAYKDENEQGYIVQN